MDNFYEQLITTNGSGKYKFARVAMITFFVFGTLLMVTGSLIPSIMFLIFGGAIFYFKKNFYIEYEYAFTNGEIDIDKILEKKKRVRVITFKVKDCEIIASNKSDEVKSFPNKPQKVLNLYPDTYTGEIYTAMITGGTTRMQLNFAPDKEMLEHCFKYNPRAVKKN